jgi:hypothetical protein
MKKLVGVLAAVVACAAIAVSGASAEETPTPLYEATGFACGVIDRGGGFVSTTDSYIVQRQNGDVYLRCEAWGTPGATIETRTDFACGLLQFGSTNESKNVVRRNGRIQLECWGHVNPS